MSRRKSKARARRRSVNRAERVKPSALAEAKKRPWIMQTLLQRGPDNLGTTAEQHEAAIEIAEAFAALTAVCALRGSVLGAMAHGLGQGGFVLADLGPRQLRLVSIYLRWASELILRQHLRGVAVVEWINGDRALGCSHIPMLVRALDLWTKHRDEWRPAKLTTTIAAVLTAPQKARARSATPTSPNDHADPTAAAPRALAQAS